MTEPEIIAALLKAVAQGEVSPEQALGQLKDLSFETVGDFAKIDHHRQLRTGFPEVIWGEGKTLEQLIEIMQTLVNNVLSIRVRCGFFSLC